MKLAQVVTTPDGEESLLLIAQSGYESIGVLRAYMRRRPTNFILGAVYTLVTEMPRLSVDAMGNVTEAVRG